MILSETSCSCWFCWGWSRKGENTSPPLKLPVSSANLSSSVHRTNSDSALHTSVMNPPSGDPFTTGAPTLTLQRRTGYPQGKLSYFSILLIPSMPSGVLLRPLYLPLTRVQMFVFYCILVCKITLFQHCYNSGDQSVTSHPCSAAARLFDCWSLI